MSLLSAPKRLFIPNKNKKDTDYATDMRAIEIFNPINKIVAGSGVTLNPSNGEGPQVEISASGGGSTPGIFVAIGGYDAALDAGPLWRGVVNAVSNQMYTLMVPGAAINTTFGPDTIGDGMGWFTFANSGGSVTVLPTVYAPAFTGAAHISVAVDMWAYSIDATTQIAYYTSNTINLTTGATYQFTPADMNLQFNSGGDLVMTAGTGQSGNGLVAQTGGYAAIGATNIFLTYVGAVF